MPSRNSSWDRIWDPAVTPGLFGTCVDATAMGWLVLTVFYRYDSLIVDGL